MAKARNRFNPPKSNPVHTPEKTLTQQHFKEELDINHMAKMHLRGVPPRMNPRQPRYGEVPSASFHEMCNVVADVNQRFLELPSKLRKRFQNDPYQMLRFTEKPENRAEALKLGLLNPEADDFYIDDEGKKQDEVPKDQPNPPNPPNPPKTEPPKTP